MIDSFTGDFDFLSNFYPCEIVYEGWIYPSVEHAYQALKTVDMGERKFFYVTRLLTPPNTQLTAGQAKRLGRTVTIREDWSDIKLAIMSQLIDQKFNHYELRRMLIDTHPQELVEGNWWGDTFWGVCEGIGKNNLGKILMNKRAQIISERFYV